MATRAAVERRKNPRSIFHLAGVTAPRTGSRVRRSAQTGKRGAQGRMPIWPFKRSKADADAARLLTAVTAASRRSDLFGEGRAPDTLEGRFEIMSLGASLALFRLRADQNLAPLSQAFTDKLFR